MAIRGVGFDYLGVTAVIPGSESDIFVVLGELLNIEPVNVKAAYERHNRGFMTGEYSQEELWRRVALELKVIDRLPEILSATKRATPEPVTAVLDLADKLRLNGYRVGCLSNLASGTDWDAALYAAGIDKHFDALLLSGDLGFAKPDPKAFMALAEAMGVATDELVFIDDRASSLLGVEKLGIMPVVYGSHEQPIEMLISQLETLGVKI